MNGGQPGKNRMCVYEERVFRIEAATRKKVPEKDRAV